MLEDIFPGDSEMARRMREVDWSKTTLGRAEDWHQSPPTSGRPKAWPQPPRPSVSPCLACAFPTVLGWGPSLTILYNDEYQAILGPAKHPSALGEDGAKVWAEIWDIIGPMLSTVYHSAQATRSRDLMLSIVREGYPEEAYFSF